MKNFFKFLGIIALVAVIGFSMAGCKTDDEESGDGGGGGSSDFTGTWEGTSEEYYDNNGDGHKVPVIVVITGDSIKITANSKEFNGTLAAVIESTYAGITSYARAISGEGSGHASMVSKFSEESTITLSFSGDDNYFDTDSEALSVIKMTKK
jgi:hypothetical protein